MRAIRAVAIVAAQIVLAGIASAATLDQVSGTVMVDRGKGPVRVSGSTQVNPGDVVTTTGGGRARIVYSNGCTTAVETGTAATVTFDDHCALGLNGDNTLLIGAGMVGLGVGAAVLLHDDHNHKPASP